MNENEKTTTINGIEINIRKTKRHSISKKIHSLIPLLATLVFLILGFCFGKWHPGWVVFLTIPLFEIVLGLFEKRGKALWTGLAFIVSVIVYLVLGFTIQAWHPGWLVFFLVPIVGVLAN